jgi:putative ATPase
MVQAGEDPRFIARRLVILSAEDVGLADPNGLVVAAATLQAVQFIGLPEAVYPLAEATLYLATAPKSNSAGAYFKALELIQQEGTGEVPTHLMDKNRDGPALGHGQGYQHPHMFPGHYVAQQYLPDKYQGVRFYEPTEQGYEKSIRQRMEQLGEAARQAAADNGQKPE